MVYKHAISTIVPARAVSLQHEKQQAAAPVQVETHSANKFCSNALPFFCGKAFSMRYFKRADKPCCMARTKLHNNYLHHF